MLFGVKFIFWIGPIFFSHLLPTWGDLYEHWTLKKFDQVDNCDRLSKPRLVKPNLNTEEPVCPDGQLQCGNGKNRPSQTYSSFGYGGVLGLEIKSRGGGKDF